jgi:hypothetical protein
MRAPPFRLVIWSGLALGVVVAQPPRGLAYLWFAIAVSALVGAGLFVKRPPSRDLDRLIDPFRRLRILIVRPIGRHPWITAAVLFVAVALAAGLPWAGGIPNLGLHAWHDCESNLLQARLIAEGRLSRPGLEHPDFFRTIHVLVTPIYCSKYPPGYPALMAAGLLVGCVEWIPPILVGAAIAASWLFGRRILGPWLGLLGALALATCPLVMDLGMIQMSNTLCFLLGVLILGLWASRGRDPDVPRSRRGLLIGLLLAGMLVTRSLDAVALGLVLAVAHLSIHGLRRAASWRWVAMMCLGGLPGAVGLLAYHHATTGDWLHSPYMMYERQQNYLGQFLHEKVRPPPNLESLPVNVRKVAEEFNLPAQRAHTVRHLPVAVGVRFAWLSRDLCPALLLLPLAVLPAAFRCRASGPMLGICVGYFAVYLLHAFNQPRFLAPVLVGLVWAMLAGLAGVRPRRTASLLQVLFLLMLATSAFAAIHRQATSTFDVLTRRFHDLLATLPSGPKLIFVRYAPDHSYHREFVYNQPDLDRAEHVFAHDLGEQRNPELIAAYRDRRAVFLYDEAARSMRPYPSE